ncbi:hypothetical protein IEO21_01771 [Rhodonia placenta]|uniref:Uncharacterized protein n=1 Tax=Rhodonia placenta TaxID=104341 RepID=A0A8H7P9B3_9APHY|nr:hypothetical protein IEO21_01771 [Postia placenta]
MSDKVARTLTNPSNRAKPKDDNDRRIVYRSVLENPFRIQWWPSVPVNLQNSILARVIDMSEGVSEYHLSREKMSRKRKRSQKGSNSRRSKRRSYIDPAFPPAPRTEPDDETSGNSILPQPVIRPHLTTGINEVTKLLERVAQSYRQTISALDTLVPESRSDTASILILVCRGDVDPPILIDHLPYLVAACNSSRSDSLDNGIWLVPLQKGAESSLADALGLRRVSVLAVHGDAPRFRELAPLLGGVQLLRASWLIPRQGQHERLVPTHVKQLRTTAPKDMKGAKEQRARSRAAARERKKEKKQKVAQKTVISSAAPLCPT